LEIPHEIRWTLRMRQLTATPRCLEKILAAIYACTLKSCETRRNVSAII
jgi:hypothetical protein